MLCLQVMCATHVSYYHNHMKLIFFKSSTQYQAQFIVYLNLSLHGLHLLLVSYYNVFN